MKNFLKGNEALYYFQHATQKKQIDKLKLFTNITGGIKESVYKVL